jgi:hypothetical protein
VESLVLAAGGVDGAVWAASGSAMRNATKQRNRGVVCMGKIFVGARGRRGAKEARRNLPARENSSRDFFRLAARARIFRPPEPRTWVSENSAGMAKGKPRFMGWSKEVDAGSGRTVTRSERRAAGDIDLSVAPFVSFRGRQFADAQQRRNFGKRSAPQDFVALQVFVHALCVVRLGP